MITYPSFLKRIMVMTINFMIIGIIFFTLVIFLNKFEIDDIYIVGDMFIVLVIILDPILITLTGGTMGHHLLKTKVLNNKTNKNINLFLSVLRFIVKIFFGGLSFLFILITNKKRALHDIISNSVVVNVRSFSHYD